MEKSSAIFCTSYEAGGGRLCTAQSVWAVLLPYGAISIDNHNSFDGRLTMIIVFYGHIMVL